jgi:hypothetical protein
MFKYLHYLMNIYCSVMQHSHSCYIRTFYDQQSLPLFVYKLCLYNNRCLFFCRLKINHESHEFILDSGTVVNKYNSQRKRVERGLVTKFWFPIFLFCFHQRTSSSPNRHSISIFFRIFMKLFLFAIDSPLYSFPGALI